MSEAPSSMNVAEKKAFREADAKITSLTQELKSKFDSPALTVTVDWAAYANFRDYAQLADKTSDNMVAHAAHYFENLAWHLGRLSEDADYRAELAKITAIHWNPKKIDDSSVWNNGKASRNGTTLTIDFDACKIPGNFDWSEAIKALF